MSQKKNKTKAELIASYLDRGFTIAEAIKRANQALANSDNN